MTDYLKKIDRIKKLMALRMQGRLYLKSISKEYEIIDVDKLIEQKNNYQNKYAKWSASYNPNFISGDFNDEEYYVTNRKNGKFEHSNADSYDAVCSNEEHYPIPVSQSDMAYLTCLHDMEEMVLELERRLLEEAKSQ